MYACYKINIFKLLIAMKTQEYN